MHEVVIKYILRAYNVLTIKYWRYKMNYQIIDGCTVYDLESIEEGVELKAKDIPLELTESDEFDEIVEDYEWELYEHDEDHELWMTKGYLHIPEIHAKVHDVDYCRRMGKGETDDPDGEPEYMADFSGWMFFHDETNEWLYEEGYSSFSAAISNGFKKNIEDLKCDVYA